MSRCRPVFSITFALLLAAGAIGATGCKSGLHERCQISADCEDGLVCAEGTGTCVESVSDGIDGGIDAPIDASETDGSQPIDASLPIDAAVEIDAAIDAT